MNGTYRSAATRPLALEKVLGTPSCRRQIFDGGRARRARELTILEHLANPVVDCRWLRESEPTVDALQIWPLIVDIKHGDKPVGAAGAWVLVGEPC